MHCIVSVQCSVVQGSYVQYGVVHTKKTPKEEGMFGAHSGGESEHDLSKPFTLN